MPTRPPAGPKPKTRASKSPTRFQAAAFCASYWNQRRATTSAQLAAQPALERFPLGIGYDEQGGKLVFAHEMVPGVDVNVGPSPSCVYMAVATVNGPDVLLATLNSDVSKPLVDFSGTFSGPMDVRPGLWAHHLVPLILYPADLHMKVLTSAGAPSTTSAPSPATTTPSTSHSALQKIGTDAGLPVYACPTSSPLPGPHLPRLPDARPPGVSASIPNLGVYANDGLSLLAPAGWQCSASESQDGTDTVTVYPPGQTTATPGEVVAATLIPGCVACIGEQACTYFQAAKKLLSGSACPTPPAGEQHVPTRPTSVDFADPPGVAGSGYASGGTYTANGVQNFVSTTGDQHAARETCTLPDSDHAMCSAILDDFIHRYASRLR